MFFAKSGVYKPCNIFSIGHLVLAIITITTVIIALKKTLKKNVQEIIKKCTIYVWIFEVIIIIFKISENGIQNVNRYIPLYYCSLLLYAGILSSFGKGKLKRIGDTFLATGTLIGGITYLIYPSTSLPEYPMFHLVSFHSFIFHCILIYLGLLINISNYIELKKDDIFYYAVFVGTACVLAHIVNCVFDSNLMFISKNFPGTIIEIMFNITGRYYTLFAIIGQMTLPFYVVYGIRNSLNQKDETVLDTVTNGIIK